ncbi:DUF4349 domain-containing protein [Massilia sp. 9I]|uniref:DUF4349 domain-containing protein n=1 Tax=Massilia sp. 9I TaxID=2653152 RepID=UPI0012F2A1BF|nr:DUF4349 domain-containing protein [Massilia sp. 9I]VXA95599.1 conserved exported hypothetical protein [Massilia sp. 9I]
MRRWVFLLVLSIVLAGCSGRQNVAPANAPALAEVRVDHKRAAWIAYEHAIALELPSGQTRQVSEAVQHACAALPERACTLLEASIRAGDEAGATIRMRVSPDGVNKVLSALDGRGTVVEQSSKGQDLAEPIENGERKMAMLTGYRDQLQTLARQRALDAEALIKLHRELAEVQSQIDSAANSQAQLRRRVDTELLTVDLHERVKARQGDKVRQAAEDFGGDLLQGVAMLITFVASTIPFVLAGTLAYVVWRKVRKGRRKAANGPDEP